MTSGPRPCARCGKDIPAERVEALPETEVCVTCSNEMGGEFITYAVAEKTSKADSLKKNYGSYGVKRVRKPIKRKE
jgi:DNA-directed RNA polymerase subunit RPC12/RpoP